MVEVLGDSARGDEFALVRLEVAGDRILAAEAAGLDRPLEGLTLLEAAAVGGETVAVDALANALARVFQAPPDPGRVAVAMSGGVGDGRPAPLGGRPQGARRGGGVLLAGRRAGGPRGMSRARSSARHAGS